MRETGVHATFEVRSRSTPMLSRAVREAGYGPARGPLTFGVASDDLFASTYWSVGASMDEPDLLHELEPTVERLLERHLATTKEWFPHEHVPYGRGRDFDAGAVDRGRRRPRRGDDRRRRARSLVVNLLTEDNLPYYFRTIERVFGDDGRGARGPKRWTAEEAATRWRSTAT